MRALNFVSAFTALSLIGAGSALAEDGARDGQQTLSVMRYMAVDTGTWPETVNRDLSDLYTRIEIFSCWDASTPSAQCNTLNVGQNEERHRDYEKEERGLLARLFSSETQTVTTTANLEVKEPELKLAVPLFSISDSSSQSLGNVWTTNYTASNLESPLFRVGANTSLIIHLNAKVSADLKSEAASSIIGAVTRAVQIAAPTSTLLTTLSQTDISNTAQAIDSAISGMFSQDITEDIEIGRFAHSWTEDAHLTLTGCAPFVRTAASMPAAQDADSGKAFGCYHGSPDFDGNPDTPIGRWIIRFECPRLSVFRSDDICTSNFETVKALRVAIASQSGYRKSLLAAQSAIAGEVSDAQVLGFNLSSQISVQTFVTSQDWYTTFVKIAAPGQTDVGKFCSSALASLYNSGLNKFDSALVLRAMVAQIPALVPTSKSFRLTRDSINGKICDQLMSDTAVTLQTNTAVTLPAK